MFVMNVVVKAVTTVIVVGVVMDPIVISVNEWENL